MRPPRLLVFAREPQPGRVKTRLIPALGAAGAAALYRRLLAHTLEVAVGMSEIASELWYDGSDTAAECARLARHYDMPLHAQQGADLGERMRHALADALGRADAAVLIGSDCADFDAAYVRQAFAALEQDDAVFGPAADGGYVLIGVRRVDHSLFMDIPWSTDRVMERTRERLRALGWGWRELATPR
jgi:rSAM/selenodomain-associated transferase 1